MESAAFKHVYGPVPSRRLGRSLGIDLVPFKTCSYDCVYCQLGRTTLKTVERKEYVPVGEVLAEAEEKLAGPDRPDYVSLAGSGEPTLHAGIGKIIERLKRVSDVPVAVLTNGSLLWKEEVRADLAQADLVLPSLDAGDKRLFAYVNRPHEEISFDRMTEGLTRFTRDFAGEVWLEVLLLGGVTSFPLEVAKISAIAQRIGPARVQLNTATRPPTEDWAFPLSLAEMEYSKKLFDIKTEVICEFGGAAPAESFHGAAEKEIVSLLSRRPCTPADVAAGLGINLLEALKHLEKLVAEGKARFSSNQGRIYYFIEPGPAAAGQEKAEQK